MIFKLIRPFVLFDEGDTGGTSAAEAKPDDAGDMSVVQTDMIDDILDFAGSPTPETKKEAATAADVDPADLVQKSEGNVEEAEPEPKPEPEPEPEPKVEAKDAETKPEPEKKEKPEKADEGEPKRVTLTEELKASLNLGDDFQVGDEIELVDEETEGDSETDEAPLTDREKALIAEMNRLAGLAGQQPQVQVGQEQQKQAQQTEPEQPQQQQAQPQQQSEPISFDIANEENFDEFVNSAEGLNKFGSELASKSVQLTTQAIIPQLRTLIPQYMEIARTTERFFEQNSDLAPAKQYFGQVINQIKSENPNLGFQELLEKAGKETRKRLGLSGKQAQPKAQNSDTPRPASPSPKKVQRRKPAAPPQPKKTSTQEGQIDEILDYATI